MAASDLLDAAGLTYERSSLRWLANTLRANFQAYLVACAAVVPDTTENDRTVGNWLVPMTALAAQMNASSSNPLEQELYNTLVDYVYRFNLAGYYAEQQGRITNAQATQLLNAFNANIF